MPYVINGTSRLGVTWTEAETTEVDRWISLDRVKDMETVTVEIQLRWGDADAYGHINNAAITRILEEARTRGFWRSESDGAAFPALGAEAPIWSVVAEMQIKYLQQVDYQNAPIPVTMWVERLRGASFDIVYELRSKPEDQPRVSARSTIVTIDADHGRPCRIPAPMKDALQQWVPA